MLRFILLAALIISFDPAIAETAQAGTPYIDGLTPEQWGNMVEKYNREHPMSDWDKLHLSILRYAEDTEMMNKCGLIANFSGGAISVMLNIQIKAYIEKHGSIPNEFKYITKEIEEARASGVKDGGNSALCAEIKQDDVERARHIMSDVLNIPYFMTKGRNQNR
jgi:hypothetical protein